MATEFHTTTAPSRIRLLGLGASVIDNPLPRDPSQVALVMHTVRCYEIRSTGDTFRADYHLRMGEYLPLAVGTTLSACFAAIAEHITSVWNAPGHYTAEGDVALRRAAAAVLGAADILLVAA